MAINAAEIGTVRLSRSPRPAARRQSNDLALLAARELEQRRQYNAKKAFGRAVGRAFMEHLANLERVIQGRRDNALRVLRERRR